MPQANGFADSSSKVAFTSSVFPHCAPNTVTVVPLGLVMLTFKSPTQVWVMSKLKFTSVTVPEEVTDKALSKVPVDAQEPPSVKEAFAVPAGIVKPGVLSSDLGKT